MSTRPVIFNLVNCIIGVSVLAMPFCFQECGIVLCGIAIISSSWLTKKSCELLLKAGQVARRRNYEGLAFSTYGAPGKLVVEASIIGLLIGTLIAFNVIIGDLVPSIFQNLTGIQVSWTIRAVIMTVLAFCVGLPLSLMRNLHSLASFSACSLLFYAGFVLQIFLSTLPRILEGSWIYNLNYWRPENLLHYLPIFALAFACQTQLFALYETLPEPSVKKMEGVVNTGINIVASVYFLVGFLGYICFYNDGVKGDMLTNYGNTFISQIVKLGFVMSVIVSFPLMVYPLRASLHSLMFQQSGSSENLPGGASFIPQDRFTYLTLAIISGTLTLGILFPQIEFVLALTGATMGTLIAFVYPSTMFLHVVSEKTTARFIAKLVLVLGLTCFVAGTYTVLTTQESGEHHQVNIHPPGIDPIKPVVIHDSSKKENGTGIHVGIREAPVDVDVAKIGLGADKNVNKDEKVVTDAKPDEQKLVDAKPIDTAPNDGGLKKAEEPVKPVELSEMKRQEPPVPHAPQDNPPQNSPDQRQGEEEHLKNEKRQLMSKGEDEKPSSSDNLAKNEKLNAVNSDAIKVSEQEIEEELKKLEHTDKVPGGISAKETDSKDPTKLDVSHEVKPQQDRQDKNLVKRDLAQDSVHLENELEDTNKLVGIVQNDNVVVSQNSGNQTKLQDIEVNNQASQELPLSKEYSLDERTFLVNYSKPLLEKSPNLGESIKIRDLKSNVRQKEKETSSLSSRSIQTLLSKQRSKRSRRSRLQGEAR